MSVTYLLATVPDLAALATSPSVSAVSGYQLTGGRLTSLVGAALGLAGAALVVLARRRRDGRVPRGTASVGAALGLAGALVGAVILAIADGGPGSGSGVVGGVVCLVIGIVVAVTAVRTLRRAPEHEGAA